MTSLDELLTGIVAFLRYGDNDWRARAVGARDFAQGATPREAVEKALGVSAPPAAPEDNSDLF